MTYLEPFYRLYESRIVRHLERTRLPEHIGVILDGHRRYAKAEGLADYAESYRTGMAKLEELLGWCSGLGIPALTVWLLSTDNLSRPADELGPYFEVLVRLLERLPGLAAEHGFSLQVTGSVDLLPERLANAAKRAVGRIGTTGWRVNLALCYGGRQEIVDACRSLVDSLTASGVSPEQLGGHIDSEGLRRHLYGADLPDLDLVIRTSGEARLSGFLLWQSVYAECVFVDPYWPAFRRVDFLRALRDFARRERRFGQ